ncbi:hypothetical protein Cylst_6722 (plasmid) [Cylindrospermum stagnale PCC 7417]|uniref:Uncharacterized protein n=1 Tax=Cylindrospermum stagnale PCC 7417 TaxID=56107 RepID=K9X764_9NOST|nr:hypothetical protein [Cylindrospermum stagnale]AFZ28465.1 hypothetical protein Cylst_6722 [Cylindrospermum stagnale PCC 7417]
MEEHPDYNNLIQRIESSGYKIVSDNSANPSAFVEVKDIVDAEGKRIRLEKTLQVFKGMRYLDLEHEFGHIEQIEKFGDISLPTRRYTITKKGTLREFHNQSGVITSKLNDILEYHNRLKEFLRLYERKANVELLKEHATGVGSFRMDASKAMISPNMKKWVNENFPDLFELEIEYQRIGGREYEQKTGRTRGI